MLTCVHLDWPSLIHTGSVVSIPAGPTTIAVRDCAYGLARYAAISQAAGLVPIVEPEVLLDGDHDIDRTLEVAEAVWAETFKYLADNKVLFEGILLKPAMVTPGAECPNRASPTKVRPALSLVAPQCLGCKACQVNGKFSAAHTEARDPG